MKTKIKTNIKQRGFTLIEIMIVVVIIGILASVIAPKLFDKPGQARAVKAEHDIKILKSALGFYRLENNHNYPSTADGLEVLVGKHLDKLQQDPWNRDYIYIGSD
ncbi:MAG: type II secretion system major pseudopilin GspG, partial [Candidatus Thioglobus sp.]|nr:type II secretion system major pseudopilin GspG [Candidatus Thioglobus sp.]